MKRLFISVSFLIMLSIALLQPMKATAATAGSAFGYSLNYGTCQVQAGDTLWRLAASYRTTVGSIQALNNLSGTMLYVGQQLTVPAQVIVWRTQTGGGGGVSAAPQAGNAQEVLKLTNAERAKAGLAPLVEDKALAAVAQEKARDMQVNGYFSHTSPTYGSPFEMMRKFGITYRYAAENIAKGYQSPASVVAGWMGSSGHRANILDANLTNLGVGAAGDVWVQMFRQP